MILVLNTNHFKVTQAIKLVEKFQSKKNSMEFMRRWEFILSPLKILYRDVVWPGYPQVKSIIYLFLVLHKTWKK